MKNLLYIQIKLIGILRIIPLSIFVLFSCCLFRWVVQGTELKNLYMPDKNWIYYYEVGTMSYHADLELVTFPP